MATRSSSLQQLETLINEQAQSARDWRDELATLRARSYGTSVALTELARKPLGETAPRQYVDVVLAAPSENWAKDVERRLRHELPTAQVRLEAEGPLAPPPPPLVYTVRCEVSLPGSTGRDARDLVLAALQKMANVEVDYSKSIDLIVVTPPEPHDS
jgi:hypothetical protein